MARLPVYLQMEAVECGLASLAMVAAYHGLDKTLADLRRDYPVSRKGVTVKGIVAIADALGLATRPVKLDLDEVRHLQLPCILHWDMDHFVVLRARTRRGVIIHDPAVGLRRVSMREFGRRFTGVAVECERAAPSPSPEGARSQRSWHWFGHVRGLRRALGQIVLLAALLEMVAVLGPFFLQWTVDEALPARDSSLLDGLAVGFALLLAFGATIRIARDWLAALVGAKLNLVWSGRVLAHMLRLPLDYFERRHAGDIVSCFGSIAIVQRMFTTGLIEAMVDGAMAFATLTMMTLYSRAGAGLAAATVLLYTLLCLAFQNPMRQATAEQIVQTARQQGHFIETLRGMQVIRLFAQANHRLRGWRKFTVMQADAELRFQGLRLSRDAICALLFGLQRVGTIWFAAHAILDNRITLGFLFAFLAYLDQFASRVGALVNRILDLAVLRLHLDRVGDIVHTPPEAMDPPAPASMPAPGDHPPAIQARGLSYAYGFAEQPVLEGIDLDIEAGECVALIGPSGCGKSTLVKLLLGLLSPSSGAVLINGVPLPRFGRERLRGMTGTVMQDDTLFSGSIAENICFFDPDPNPDELRQCARLAAIHDDIDSMPMGYGTLIGETGIGLSGGQKQRIMLARALYRKPRLLVLDEATSHLDILAERTVNTAIRDLALTRIIVAHRPETIAMADRVIALSPAGSGAALRASSF